MVGGIYHILNRGVEKRKIFLDDEDRFRFANNLSDFNDKGLITFSYKIRRKHSVMRSPNKSEIAHLIEIVCWCLMPNHFHVLSVEEINNGTGLFSKKITNGYTLYFNLKNEREGVLFQGRSKKILIKKDEHFLYIPFYIFSNPIKLIEPKWREKGIKNFDGVVRFLENYKWSAYRDVIGKQNFPFVINKKLFFELFDSNEKRFKSDFYEWLRSFR